MRDVREVLAGERVVLLDGAMGTEIYRRGVFIHRCYDDLSRSSPDLIRSIHRAYREAGADVLETNTFGANGFQLQSHGLEDEVGEINRAAAGLAREVAGDDRWVGGSMGPLGVRLEPYGPTSRGEAREAYRRQAAALAEGGVDLFLLETFSDLHELLEALAGCREAAPLPVVAQMTIQPGGETTYGVSARQIAEELEEAGADAVGLNCSVGPALLLEAVREMARVTKLPISAVPNAGLPQEIQGRKMYLASPEYMASYARKLAEAGARLIGGCCGTEPEHVRRMAEELEAVSVRPRSRGGAVAGGIEVREERRPPRSPGAAAERERAEPMPLRERSGWGRKLAEGRPVVSVEVRPPRGADPEPFLHTCRWLDRVGVDAVSLPDAARASMRMSVVATAALLRREVGLEAVVHYTCRDRNLLGMTTDLLGAQALGVRNLLLVTGDPPRMGPYPEATAVFDVDSIGLANLVVRLNRGEDLAGNPIGSRTAFTVGVAVNPSAVDPERELERWYWKVDAGAEFGVTQPIFDPDRLEAFLERIEREGLRIPILAGIWPLTSLRDAEFLNHEVPGIDVPERVLERMRRAEERGPEAARAEGRAVAREVLEAIRDRVEGVQLSAPGGRVEPVLEVLASLDRFEGAGELRALRPEELAPPAHGL